VGIRTALSLSSPLPVFFCYFQAAQFEISFIYLANDMPEKIINYIYMLKNCEVRTLPFGNAVVAAALPLGNVGALL